MKRLIPTIIAIILLVGCASLKEYNKQAWHKNIKKWVVEENKKCPIKDGCFATTSIEFTPTVLTYNAELSGKDGCIDMVEDIRAISSLDWGIVAKQTTNNKVALMYVSLQYRFFDEQGNLINEFVVYGGD